MDVRNRREWIISVWNWRSRVQCAMLQNEGWFTITEHRRENPDAPCARCFEPALEYVAAPLHMNPLFFLVNSTKELDDKFCWRVGQRFFLTARHEQSISPLYCANRNKPRGRVPHPSVLRVRVFLRSGSDCKRMLAIRDKSPYGIRCVRDIPPANSRSQLARRSENHSLNSEGWALRPLRKKCLRQCNTIGMRLAAIG